MAEHDIFVIGASAGGLESLVQILPSLPSDLLAAIFIVVHIPAHLPSRLPQTLQRYSKLPVVHAIDGAAIEQGHIYVAPPDRHLLVKRDFMRVVFGPKENRTRPAIDPLFRTAAKAYGKRVVGVVLSGGLWDGTAGLFELKQRGGVAIVQDPKEAIISSMPQSAINHVAVDHILPSPQIARLLVDLAHTPVQKTEVP